MTLGRIKEGPTWTAIIGAIPALQLVRFLLRNLSTSNSTHLLGAQSPSNDGIVICLKDLLNLPGQALIFRVLIVDALDECPNTLALSSPREKVLVILEDFLNSQLPSLRICVTSRPEVGIKPEGCPCTLIFLFYFVILLYERGHTEHSEVGREHE
jgi:hypothetical protein